MHEQYQRQRKYTRFVQCPQYICDGYIDRCRAERFQFIRLVVLILSVRADGLIEGSAGACDGGACIVMGIAISCEAAAAAVVH
jgi:hypothetical protein